MDKKLYNLIKNLENEGKKEGCSSDKILELADELLIASRKQEKLKQYGETVSYYHQALYHYNKGNISLCNKYVTECNLLSEKNRYMGYYVKSCNVLGVLLSMMSEQFQALDYYLKALFAAEKLKNLDLKSRVLNNIGDMFFGLLNYEVSYQYFRRAKECREKLHKYNDDIYAIIMLNIIEADLMMNRFDEAKQYITEIENTLYGESEELLKSVVISNEILFYFNKGELEKSKEMIPLLLDRILSLREFTHSFNALMRIGKVIIYLQEEELGKRYIDTLKRLIEHSDNLGYRLRCQSTMVKYFDKMGDKEKLLDATYQYYTMNQKLHRIRDNNYSNSLVAKVKLEDTLQEQAIIKKRNKALEILSEMDDLTGVLNRRATEQKIIHRLAADNQLAYCALLIVDVDHFKEVNDQYGHMLGDKVLRIIGSELRHCFIRGNVLGRLGGDEFLVYIGGSSEDYRMVYNYVHQKIMKFQKRLRLPLDNGCQKEISVSIGVRIMCVSEATFSLLYRDADQALYRAKNSGRNCFSFYEAEQFMK